MYVFFFQAEDGIRDLVRSRGLGDVYKRQHQCFATTGREHLGIRQSGDWPRRIENDRGDHHRSCLLYTSDAADERSSVDLGGRRIIKKKNQTEHNVSHSA